MASLFRKACCDLAGDHRFFVGADALGGGSPLTVFADCTESLFRKVCCDLAGDHRFFVGADALGGGSPLAIFDGKWLLCFGKPVAILQAITDFL